MTAARQLADLKASVVSRVPAPSYRRKITFCNHDWTVSKSAMQKAVRRGQTDQCRKVVMDCWLFTVHNTGHGQWVTSNMIRRLNIILCEDVGMACPYLCNALESQLAFLNDGKSHGDEHVNVRRGSMTGLRYLLDVAEALCQAPHCRLLSYMNNMYFHPVSSAWCRTHYPAMFDDDRLAGDRPASKSDLVVWAVKKGSFLAIQFATGLTQREFWDAIMRPTNNPEVRQCLKWLKSCFKSSKPAAAPMSEIMKWEAESNLFVIQALLVVIFHFRRDSHPEDVRVEGYSPAQALSTFRNFLSGRCYTIPDEAKNMHSGRPGRQLGRSKTTFEGVKHFLLEGARMFKERKFEKHATFKEAYNAYKWQKFNKVYQHIPQVDYESEDDLPLNWLLRRKGGRENTPDIIELTNSSNDEDGPSSQPSQQLLVKDLTNPERTRMGGEKPTSLFATLHGRRVFIKPAVGNSGQLQLFADLLKPLFGLASMGVELRAGKFDFKQRGEEWGVGSTDSTHDYIVCPKADGVSLSHTPGWEKHGALQRQYVLIGLFRFGTFRFSDFNTANVLLLRGGSNLLLSIDECQQGRTSAFTSKPLQWIPPYIRTHHAELTKRIKGWRKIAADRRDMLDQIVTACGLHPQTAVDVVRNLAQLTPEGV